MTWGPLMMYYHCPKCGFKYEYALDMMTEFGKLRKIETGIKIAVLTNEVDKNVT